MAGLADEFGARIHIVHVSSAEGVEAIAAAKAASVPITAETCPHYLTFAAGEIADGATEFKCAPPIRAAAHRDALWDGLWSGALDLIATDHSPAPPEIKRPGGVGDFMAAWGGIASLELSLAATWTASLSTCSGRCGFSVSGERSGLSWLARWMSAAPASLAGLGARKGRIAAGFDADLVVWDPDDRGVVDPLRLQQRHKLTPYAGRSLAGAVATTFLRGERVWDAEPAHARLQRTAAVKDSFADLVDLASERLGGAVVAANDEFFAPKERLIMAAPLPSGERASTPSAANGWTAGKRAGGATSAMPATTGASSGSACAGIVRGVDVDTAFFKGNFPAAFAHRRLRSAGPAGARRPDRAPPGASCCRGRR